MTSEFRRLMVVLWVLLAPTTAFAASQWVMIPDENPRYANRTGNFVVTLIPGWLVRVNDRGYELTEDGTRIHAINFERRTLSGAFPEVEVEASEEMLPSELSEAMMASIRTTSGADSIKVFSDAPYDFEDRLGFRTHFGWVDGEGLRWEAVAYGFATDDSFYSMSYIGPKLIYAESEIERFDQAVSTFDLLEDRG